MINTVSLTSFLRTCAVDVTLIDKVAREQGTWWSVILVASRLNSECVWSRRKGGGGGSKGLWKGRDVVLDIDSGRSGETPDELFWSHGLKGMICQSQ